MTNEAHKPPGFSGKKMRTVLLGAAFCFLLFFLLTAVWVHHALRPANEKGQNQNFVVEEGATLKQVAVDLENADIIRSSTLFRLAGRLMGYDHHIKTGEYRLNGAIPPLKILEILKEWNVPNAEAMAADWNWVTFDILTQLGIVILAGIVVNNAILIVHQMLNNIKSGVEEREALLLSCQTRLRPIMMTVISSVFGMIPLAFGEGAGTELYRGMGTALIGGLSISTLFTLFLVPVLISLLIDMGFHTRKEDLVKESMLTPTRLMANPRVEGN